MTSGQNLSSLQTVLKMTRQAMFGLGVAVFVGILGQAAAIYVAGQGTEVATATPIARQHVREAGVRTPQHSGFANAARRFEAVYGRDGDEIDAAR